MITVQVGHISEHAGTRSSSLPQSSSESSSEPTDRHHHPRTLAATSRIRRLAGHVARLRCHVVSEALEIIYGAVLPGVRSCPGGRCP
jgi:hypothetical protein